MELEQNELFQALEEQYTCPISKIAIRDPVITSDGHTYERDSITHWLTNQNKSPKTGLQLASKQLIPNVAFKSLVEKLNLLLPKYISEQDNFKQQVQQLKNQIAELKQEISLERQHHESLVQINQRHIKAKRIEKRIYENKKSGISKIRQQKQKYQKLWQQIKLDNYYLKRQSQNSKQISQKNSSQLSTLKEKEKELTSKALTILVEYIEVRSCCQNLIKKQFLDNLHTIAALQNSFEEISKQSNKIEEQNGLALVLEQCVSKHYQLLLDDDNKNEAIVQENAKQQNMDISNIQGYRKFKSLSWLMKGRRTVYQVEPFIRVNDLSSKQKRIFGIQISIYGFNRPFNQFISHQWNFLQFLNLSKCSIDNEGLSQFFNKSSNFEHLILLNLEQNNITSFNLQNIIKYPDLCELNLEKNKLNQNNVQQIQKYLSQPEQIKKITIKYDKDNDAGQLLLRMILERLQQHQQQQQEQQQQ